MHTEQRERARSYLAGAFGYTHQALFSNINTIKWLTGFAPPVQSGPNPFAGGPSLLWYDDGKFTLIVQDAFVPSLSAFAAEPDCTLVGYPAYTIEAPIASTPHLVEALAQTLGKSNLRGKRIGVELNDLTAPLMALLQGQEGLSTVGIDGWCEPLRAVKTAEELAKMRANFHLTDLAHAAARAAVRAGQREIDVWDAAHSAVHKAAGQRVPMGNDCVVGYREGNNIGGWPLNLEIRPNDSIIVDLSTVMHGYWSDSCATYYAGKPNQEQIAMHDTAAKALELGKSLLKPGAVARDIDQKLRRFIADAGYPVYPHHSGHSLGVGPHEIPRIVPYAEEVLQEGMVIMLEPGIYFPGKYGVRLEDAFLITANGAEVLTQHDKTY